jgi:FliI/YscN family ATPase
MFELDEQIRRIMPTAMTGRVARIVGTTAAVAGLPAPVGALVELERQSGDPLRGEVIGFRDDMAIVYPQSDLTGVRRGNAVRLVRTLPWLAVGDELLGRVVNAAGEVIDHGPQPVLPSRTLVDRNPPSAVSRPRIKETISTGIRSIDALLTCGKGQRMGIFAGSGVGKSVTLGMMARYTSADINVVALIGERGREVNDFIERDLGPEGLKRSVVIVATSDEPAITRVRAALSATAIAEYFRDQGRDVLLMMDSVTRFAQAQREIGLAAGEPPTTRGFPPSVFAMLPKLFERAGLMPRGSITAFYTVLVEADDPNEPIGDATRGLLDGHTWLSRKLASRGHYPAIDVLGSLSRLMNDIVPPEHLDAALALRELLSVYRDHEDLISIGAYRRGGNPVLDLAIEMQEPINQFLRQRVDEASSVEESRQALIALLRTAAARGGGHSMANN